MANQLTTGVARRLGPSGSRWLLVATCWSAYLGYLEAIVRQLGMITLPGLGEMRLDETFVPLYLRPWPGTQAADLLTQGEPPTITLSEALEADPFVLLIGPAGTGKSSLLRWHAIELARVVLRGGRRVLFADGGPPPLPVYVPLADVPEATSVAALAARLDSLGWADATEFLEAHLVTGRAVLLFDDLDTLTTGRRQDATRRIAELVEHYPGNRVVVATRDGADRARLPGFRALEVTGIDPARVETLAARWGYSQLASTSGFLQVVERFPLVRSLAARPGWLATCLASVAETSGSIRAHDIVSGFVRQLDPGKSEVWPPIALALHQAGTAVGQAVRVPRERRSSGLLQWLSNDEFRFVHPAVQVFFAAAAADMSALVGHAGEPWWDPVIVLAAGHMAEPRPLIDELAANGHTVLAALALAETRPALEDLGACITVELLGSLGHGGRDDDRTAAIGLASLLGAESVGHTGVVAPALAALVHDVPAVRRAAAEALARLGDPSAIAPLLAALGDPDDAVRCAASEALASFGERTVQPLVRQLNVSDERVRRAAVSALAHQGSRAVAALIPLLEGPSPMVRAQAAEALAAIGEPAVPALIEVLQQASPEGNRTAAQVQGVADALTKIGQPAATALVPLYASASPALARRIVAILHAMGLQAVAALAGIIATPDHPHTGAAAALLGELPDVGQAAATHLVRALTDGRFEVRWEARRSLRRIGASAQAALLKALRGEDPHLRWEAAEILLALPEPPVEALTRVLTEFYGTGDVAGRRRALQALGMLSGSMVQATVERALHDPDPLVRRSAIDQLGRLGDPAATAALVERWPMEEDPDTAVTLLDTLALLAPEAAIPTLLDALAADSDRVRRSAADLLIELGEPAVVPLVEALNAHPAELDLEGALRVLDRVGSVARAGGRAPANLARAYHRMLVEPHDVDELIYLATTIEWWPPALELHRTFATAKEFLEYRALGGLGSAEARLEWVDEIEIWLRPGARQAFRQLRMISQAVQYYNRGATRRSKEKGLLAAADRLNSLRAIIGELGEPHTRVFHTVAEHWSDLINQAIRELQGKADLDVDIRTEHVRIRDVDTAAVLVFELVNRGEGLASNIQLALHVDEEKMVVQSSPTHFLPPLGQGDRISVEFTVRRSGAGVVPVTVPVRYDDPQKSGLVRTFAREVRFFVEEAEYRDIGTSPYIAGPPVKSPEMFYGRHATFTWIQENLSGTYQDNVLVLYGERRTGKTSVLYQLGYHLPGAYALVLVDLQSIAYALGSTSDLLYAMARKITNGLQRQGFDLPRPEREAYNEHPIEQFEALGELIGQMARASDRGAVLIADEFDLLIEAVDDGRVSPYVFDCIRGLMQHQDGLSFIFAGAHKLSAMLKNPQSILFNTALRRKVSFLEPGDAERLIRQPVSEVLWFDDLAVEKILRVTAGQPYFIQYICHEIVNLARRDTKNFVSLRDVDRALQTTVQETTGIIRHSYMSLDRDGQIALAALARVTDDGRPFAGFEDIVETLRQDGVTVTTRDLSDTLRQLAERDFMAERGGDGTGRQYGFTMDLVRVWLEQNDEYTRLLEELRG